MFVEQFVAQRLADAKKALMELAYKRPEERAEVNKHR
jgi:hypothetical protein